MGEDGRLRSVVGLVLVIRSLALAVVFPVVTIVQITQVGWFPPSVPMVSCLVMLVAVFVTTAVLKWARDTRIVHLVAVLGVIVDTWVIVSNVAQGEGATERGAYLGLVLVIVEAAIFWMVPGGATAGAIAAIGAYFRFDPDARANDAVAVVFRSAALVAIGVVMGLVVLGLERSRGMVLRQLRAIEVVARFGDDLRNASIEEVGQRAADTIVEQLQQDRAFVAIRDGNDRALAVRGGTIPSQEEIGMDWETIIDSVKKTWVVPVNAPYMPDIFGAEVSQDALFVLVPIRSQTNTFGFLSATTRSSEYELEAMKRTLESLAVECAQFLERERLSRIATETIEELRVISALKDDFLAITSHELRTPVTALRGYLRALDAKDSLTPEAYSAATEAIHRQTRRIQTLIEHLLAASTIDAGSMVPIPEQVDIGHVVEEVLLEHASIDPRVQLVAHIPPDVPMMECDGGFFRRILVNLVSNAVKYSPDGGEVNVVVTPTHTASGRAAIDIAVSDQGIGIAKADLPKLFGRFQRLAADRARGGTGLGLYIVRGLAESMGGTVHAASTLGIGSTFRVVLPLRMTNEFGEHGQSAWSTSRQAPAAAAHHQESSN